MEENKTVLKQEDMHLIIQDLQKRIKHLEVAAFSNAPGKTQKLMRIIELAEINQEVSVSMVKSEFKIRSSDYARKLLQEATATSELNFFKGQPGQESFVTKFKIENKAMHAYAEVYRELQSRPIGTTITESAIAHRYDLNGQELQSVIGHIARHNEMHVIIPMNRKGCRRVKRVR